MARGGVEPWRSGVGWFLSSNSSRLPCANVQNPQLLAVFDRLPLSRTTLFAPFMPTRWLNPFPSDEFLGRTAVHSGRLSPLIHVHTSGHVLVEDIQELVQEIDSRTIRSTPSSRRLFGTVSIKW